MLMSVPRSGTCAADTEITLHTRRVRKAALQISRIDAPWREQVDHTSRIALVPAWVVEGHCYRDEFVEFEARSVTAASA